MVIPGAVLLHEALRAGAPASRVADRLDELAAGAESRFLATWAMGMNLLAAETWAGTAPLK